MVLGHILVTHSTPSAGSRDGSRYRDTLFGAILATSCLPRYGLGYQASEQVSIWQYFFMMR